MTIDELKDALKKVSHDHYIKYSGSIGPRGGKSSETWYYKGSYRYLQKVIESIEKDDVSILYKGE